MSILMALFFSCIGEDSAVPKNNTDPDLNDGPIVIDQGLWTVFDGTVLPEESDCSFDQSYLQSIENSVIPENFLVRTEDSQQFSMLSPEQDNLIPCERQTDTEEFTCSRDTYSNWVLVIEGADIEVLIESVASGKLVSNQEMELKYEIELRCLDVDHWFGLDCLDIETYFATPCTISFTTHAENIE